MRKCFLIFAASIVFLSAHAENVTVVGDQFNHLYERNANGAPSGLGVDVLHAIAKITGDTIDFQFVPFARAQAMVEFGKADILVSIYKTPEREKRFDFSAYPYYQDQMTFYMRTGSSLRWTGDFNSLKGKRVGVIRGWHYGEKFQNARSTLTIATLDNLADGVKLLRRGFIDVLAANQRNMGTFLEPDQTGQTIEAMEPMIDLLPGYLAFRKGEEGSKLRDKFNHALKTLIDSGELSKMLRDNHVSEFVELSNTGLKSR